MGLIPNLRGALLLHIRTGFVGVGGVGGWTEMGVIFEHIFGNNVSVIFMR